MSRMRFFSTKKRKASIMHQGKLLHKMLSSVIHQKRLTTLEYLVNAALQLKKLSLTNIGRGIDLPIQERSGIKRADRFIGNKCFYKEKDFAYKAYIQKIAGSKTRPRILVDWSPVPNTTHHVLRAALVADGRALTLYEEVKNAFARALSSDYDRL